MRSARNQDLEGCSVEEITQRRGTPDPLDVIRWKEIYDRLEQAIDSCMAVVHSLQSISFKNA